MKSAVIPQVRVEPQLRAELEASLREGETLSEFVEAAVRDAAARRRTQAEFIARGLASRDEARRSGVYYTLEQVDARLGDLLDKARERLAAAGR
jgi:hypothetical protein